MPTGARLVLRSSSRATGPRAPPAPEQDCLTHPGPGGATLSAPPSTSRADRMPPRAGRGPAHLSGRLRPRRRRLRSCPPAPWASPRLLSRARATARPPPRRARRRRARGPPRRGPRGAASPRPAGASWAPSAGSESARLGEQAHGDSDAAIAQVSACREAGAAAPGPRHGRSPTPTGTGGAQSTSGRFSECGPHVASGRYRRSVPLTGQGGRETRRER